MINKIDHIKKITQFRDIDEVLFFLAQGVKGIFGDGLVGLYLTGSLSYGDFEEGRSDIDLAVVLKKPATPKQIAAIKQLHLETEKKFPKWGKRIECSYVPLGMLKETLPPKAPRPYVGNGIFHPQELYGNEWFINKLPRGIAHEVFLPLR